MTIVPAIRSTSPHFERNHLTLTQSRVATNEHERAPLRIVFDGLYTATTEGIDDVESSEEAKLLAECGARPLASVGPLTIA